MAFTLSGCPQLLDDGFGAQNLTVDKSGSVERDAGPDMYETDGRGGAGGSASHGRAGQDAASGGEGTSLGGTQGAGASGSTGTADGGSAGNATTGTSDASTDAQDSGAGAPDAASECGDHTQNGDETGVDCGGTCAPCVCVWSAFSTPQQITGLGFDATWSEWGPTLSADGLTLMFAAENGGTEDLYVATRSVLGTAFGAVSKLPTTNSLNTSANEGTPWLSADGLRLYFYSDRNGGLGLRDLYFSTRSTPSVDFGTPVAVGGLNSTSIDHLLWLSADELDAYFTSTRAAGSLFGANIWLAHRTTRAASFGAAAIVTVLDTESGDEGPALTSDELTVFFSSDRTGGLGQFDVWMATRTSTASAFSAPVLVPNVNSANDELNVALSADGTELFISSDRATGTTHTLWRSMRSCQ